MAKPGKKATTRKAASKAVGKAVGKCPVGPPPPGAVAAAPPKLAKAAGKKAAKKTERAPVERNPAERTADVPRNLLVPTGDVLDRLHAVILSRRDADPAVSHSARLLGRGVAKVAQKFGEEAVECLIEAVANNRAALIGESADVLYHLLVVWVAAGLRPDEVWEELHRREGVSGIAEKAARAKRLPAQVGTTKIP